MRRLLALWFVLFAGACTPRSRTQVMVVLDAEASVREQASQLRVIVRSGTSRLDERANWPLAVTSWPRRLAVVPDGDPSGRRFEFEATASSATGLRLGTVRALTSFVSGRTAELRLVLEDCCRTIQCEATQTCRGCACAPREIDPTELPDLESDAPRDAGRPDDATSPDGGRPPDALAADARNAPDAWSPPDAWSAPDVWNRPVLPEGSVCDFTEVANTCATGTFCTCSGLRGCEGGGEARCWAPMNISCSRPIDLSERFARSTELTVSADGTLAPNLSTNTCGGGGARPDVVYLVRNTTGARQSVILDGAAFEYWHGCAAAMSYGSCTGRWSLTLDASGSASAMWILVEGTGSQSLSIRRMPR